MIKKAAITCPICQKPNTWVPENKFRPFCSERCKWMDLGDWASEKYRVPDENPLPSTDSEEDK